MKLSIRKALWLCTFMMLAVYTQGQHNVSFLGNLTYSESLSDVWGYVDTAGNEYALVGVRTGTSIVDISNPSNPTELFFVPGASSTWRDIKTWDNHAYVTNESNGGLLIIDLSYLPDSIKTYTWNGEGNVTFSSAHNIFIDEKGYAYIVGADHAVGGAIIADVFTDPDSPKLATVYNTRYIHDLFVRGDTMWSAEISNGIYSVVDVSDKSPAVIPNSKVMATHATPNSFTHNCWLSDDGNYLFTTDERSSAYVAGYDVSDLANIEETDRIQSNPGSGTIPHNTFYHNGFLVTAYYRDGITIHDVNYPDNIIETGNYDTSPLSGSGFNGCWGVYPYLPSGNIIATDIENGLFVLGPDYTPACYLEGTITDTSTGNPINNVTVEIATVASANETTDLLGGYKTGVADGGLYYVTFSKTGYVTKTITNVALTNGVITQLNAELVPLVPFNLTGQVIDSATGIGVPFAHVHIAAKTQDYTAVADTNGFFTMPNIFADTYDAFAGQWGYVTKGLYQIPISQFTGNFIIEINEGYYDDFIFDFSWTATSTASTGDWVRDIPLGTTFLGSPSNPGADVIPDHRFKAYITGNGPGQAGSHDIDDGIVELASPIFDLTSYIDPYVSYYRWFFNAGGQGNPNDTLTVTLTNGLDSIVLEQVVDGDPAESEWHRETYRILDYLQLTADMQLIVTCGDDAAAGHIVEAGLDLFRAYDSLSTPEAHFGIDTTFGCPQLSVTFTDSSTNFPSDWQWIAPGTLEGTSNDEHPTFTYDTSGTFDVTLIASNTGGSDTVTMPGIITIWERPLIATTSTPDGGTGNGTAVATVSGAQPPYTYLWNDPLSQTTDTAINLTAGTYLVIVTDSNGCMDSSSVEVESATGMLSPDKMSIIAFPNPFEGTFIVEYTFPKTVQEKSPVLIIYNQIGQIVWRSSLDQVSGQASISLSDAPGIYYLQVASNHEVLMSTKLVKQ